MGTVAYLCSDLLFTSKIRETALGLGLAPAVARTPAQLATVARGALLAIIDLRRPDALDALAALRSDEISRSVPSVGFCDHERVDLFESARAAGCQRVYAKGKFSSSLAQILAGTDAAPRPVDPSPGALTPPTR